MHPPCTVCMVLDKECSKYCVYSRGFPPNQKVIEFSRVQYLLNMDNVYTNLLKLYHSIDQGDYEKYVMSLIHETTCRDDDNLHGAKGIYDRDVGQARQAQKLVEDQLAACQMVLHATREEGLKLSEQIHIKETQLKAAGIQIPK
ncbi:LOB domain-containing protein 1-like protein [Tanacetum coccineum]